MTKYLNKALLLEARRHKKQQGMITKATVVSVSAADATQLEVLIQAMTNRRPGQFTSINSCIYQTTALF